jgi:FAD/FMN-containing dehydrogenase
MTALSLNNVTGEATAQTGLKLGPLAQGLWDQGRRALPHGTCPYVSPLFSRDFVTSRTPLIQVGIGGHTAYGGQGFYSRQAGLLLDRAVRAEVVLANGTLITAAFDQNQDLYWVSDAGRNTLLITEALYDRRCAGQAPHSASSRLGHTRLCQHRIISVTC